ncbi:MAG TPA: HlyD family efflux transporter periplasmic adaptor subunit [Roseiarcus sp.]|nr:HlyD family efflux transporter periplasmic adaptor subunit [Roseiarcus sp.]
MAKKSGHGRVLLLLIAVAAVVGAGLVAYRMQAAAEPEPPLIGVVRQTEMRIAPETTGRLQSLSVVVGRSVSTGDTLAVLSNPELAASVADAKAKAAQAKADRDNVYAGVRKEEIGVAGETVRSAEANLLLAHQQYERSAKLAADNYVSRQQLDQDSASLREAEARTEVARSANARSHAGPTPEERRIADAQVALAEATVADLEAQLAKTRLVAPTDGVVTLVVGSPGEIIAPGEPVLTLSRDDERWFSFTVREDRLHGLDVGAKTDVTLSNGETIKGRVSEIRPLGEFATWRAARAVGDHDLASFLVRVDPVEPGPSIQPGATDCLARLC